MPAIIKPLLGLALLFGRLQAETPYDTLCSSPPSQPDELEPGIAATYQCGHAFYTDDWTGESSFAGTPKACALQCAQWSSEGRCGWQNNACYRYKAGKDSAARLGGVAIYIKRTASPVPDCSSIDEECKRNIAIQNDTITMLQHEKGDCEDLLGKKRTDITRLQGENQQLQGFVDYVTKGISSSGSELCPEGMPKDHWTAANDGCIFIVRGQFFKFFHQKSDHNTYDLPVILDSSVPACASACVEDTLHKCKTFRVGDDLTCYRSTIISEFPTTVIKWNTYYRLT